MTVRTEPTRRPARSRCRLALVATFLVAVQGGCTREFFRNWANQDVSEAVYEKSRDPRWRLDMFSIEPPAMSRFADPTDQDSPPAPPDDRATEALGPVPQWSDTRLLVPLEGTGYLDLLDRGPRYESPPRPIPPPTPIPAPPNTPAPFAPPTGPGPGRNSGTGTPGMSPIPVPATPPASAPLPGATPPQAAGIKRDTGLRLAAFQETGIPAPTPPARQPAPIVVPPPGTATGIPAAPNPRATPDDKVEPTDPNLSAPVNPLRPGQTPDQYRAAEAMGTEMSALLNFGSLDFDLTTEYGLPRDSQPYLLTIDEAFRLALINSRAYQSNIENVYIAAIPVTLQRFAFMPQFYAGLGGANPGITPGAVGGLGLAFPPIENPTSALNYSTHATGAPASALNIGTVAGFGKVFQNGMNVAAGFANEVVFNFFGHDSKQPKVQSFLPLTLMMPFLRGGGRAVTLEPLTQAERNLVYQVRTFALFRQQFTVATLVGGSIPNFGSAVPTLGFIGGGSDPVVGFVNLLEDLQILENTRRNVATFEQLLKVFKELKEGESSGLTQLQVDQIENNLQSARQNYIVSRNQFRTDMDGFKQQMGLPPDTPMLPDRSLTIRFKRAYEALDRWGLDPNRKLEDLPKFAKMLPDLEDIVLDGRSVLAVYNGDNPIVEEQLEDLLLAGERLVLEHRLDLMNTRAQLYDAWRQIRVTANSLKGVFNLVLTNQFVTQPANTNPLGFLDQAKQFSLVLNAELPLVRINERNNFRSAILNYQRARRNLQNTEDNLKQLIRNDIRSILVAYQTYRIARRNFELYARIKDQAFEQLVAPPQPGGGGNVANAAIQTQNLVNAQNSLIGTETALITTWYNYQSARLALYRDIGILPYDEWEAFRALFSTEEYTRDVSISDAGDDAGSRGDGPARATAARSGPAADVRRR
ncbi:MAG: TolC family protein [Isosphaeraceae bacterium]|nr:TolC family protein [Isosphaeraceae bacterium]